MRYAILILLGILIVTATATAGPREWWNGLTKSGIEHKSFGDNNPAPVLSTDDEVQISEPPPPALLVTYYKGRGHTEGIASSLARSTVEKAKKAEPWPRQGHVLLVNSLDESVAVMRQEMLIQWGAVRTAQYLDSPGEKRVVITVRGKEELKPPKKLPAKTTPAWWEKLWAW